MSNYIVAITAGTATTSNGVTDYTFILTMDSVASADESIDYQITGVGQSPTSSNDFANNQLLNGTVVFAPGETQKTITVSLLNKDKTESNEAFAVNLTSSLDWVTVATNSASVLSVLTDQPKTGGVSLVDNKVYFDVTPTTPYTPTSAADYVKVSGVRGSLDTGNGDDVIITTTGYHEIDGGAGNDNITLGTGNDNINGGAGNDNITLGTGGGSVSGGSGNDKIISSVGDYQGSSIDGGAGTDTIDFGLLQTGVSINLTNGLIQASTTDIITKISGVENVIGSNQNDTITGGKTGNNIDGGAGNDSIISNAGDDVVNGGPGSDVISGGAGYDNLTGGTGNDLFTFLTIIDLGKRSSKRMDEITDFTAGEDLIELSFDANTKVTGSQKFNFIGGSIFTHTAGELRWSQGSTIGDISYCYLAGDTNGDGWADFSIFVLGVASLQSTDFHNTLV
jgi:Ca2+-binding RTX toxin-like protein